MHRVAEILFLLLFLSSEANPLHFQGGEDSEKVEQILEKMTLNQKIGQMLLVRDKFWAIGRSDFPVRLTACVFVHIAKGNL